MNKMTKQEWEDLIFEFNYRCVRCGLEGYHLDKDHIIPRYQGGDDSLNNIQPLCPWCNCQKGPENVNWIKIRRKYGFEKHLIKKYSKKHPLKNPKCS